MSKSNNVFTLGCRLNFWESNQINNLLSSDQKKVLKKQKLSQVERDRVKVLLISFLMIIVFWGAFEQAGGLMNLYAKQKTDRFLMGWEIPASWFQSLNAFFIVTLAVIIGGIWMRLKIKGTDLGDKNYTAKVGNHTRPELWKS